MIAGKRLFTVGRRSSGAAFRAQRAVEEAPIKVRGQATHTAPRCPLTGCASPSPVPREKEDGGRWVKDTGPTPKAQSIQNT